MLEASQQFRNGAFARWRTRCTWNAFEKDRKAFEKHRVLQKRRVIFFYASVLFSMWICINNRCCNGTKECIESGPDSSIALNKPRDTTGRNWSFISSHLSHAPHERTTDGAHCIVFTPQNISNTYRPVCVGQTETGLSVGHIGSHYNTSIIVVDVQTVFSSVVSCIAHSKQESNRTTLGMWVVLCDVYNKFSPLALALWKSSGVWNPVICIPPGSLGLDSWFRVVLMKIVMVMMKSLQRAIFNKYRDQPFLRLISWL